MERVADHLLDKLVARAELGRLVCQSKYVKMPKKFHMLEPAAQSLSVLCLSAGNHPEDSRCCRLSAGSHLPNFIELRWLLFFGPILLQLQVLFLFFLGLLVSESVHLSCGPLPHSLWQKAKAQAPCSILLDPKIHN